MEEKFSFESTNTRRYTIPSLPIDRTEEAKIETESIEKLSNEQKKVFEPESIKKIKASATSNYSDKKKDLMYDGATLLSHLNKFGKYPKNMKKKDIVAELLSLYEKYNQKSSDNMEPTVKITANASKTSKYDDFM